MICGRIGGGGRDRSTVNGATSTTCTVRDDVVFVFEVCGRVGVALMGFEVDRDLKFG